jgi:S-adenosylmethionine synthetase
VHTVVALFQAARHIAKNLVAAGVADQVLVQVAYAIGVAKPVGLYVTTYNTTKATNSVGQPLTDGEIADKVNELFDLRPYAIVERFGLRNPIFGQTAAYGHMGRQPSTVTVKMKDGDEKTFETFTWEKLDYVDRIKELFNL